MLQSLKDWFDSLAPRAEPAQAPEGLLQLAAAVLLVEVMRSDSQTTDEERAAVMSALRRRFALNDAEVDDMLQRAEQTARASHDLHSFTSRLNDSLDHAQKVLIIEHLWEVAYADAQLSAHEHHVIRKIADLLHVPHGAYISAKMRAKHSAGQS
jgi:uncharacterized tellurite resistance protein B-like protein